MITHRRIFDPITRMAVLLCGFFFCVSHSLLVAQTLQVTGANTPPFTPTNLIQNIFLGEGVEVTNINYTGDPIAVGYFTGGQTAVGIDRGIVLTSGRAAGTNTAFGAADDGSDFASNANSGGAVEPNLGTLVNVPLEDVAVYTISFIPTSDTLRFRYCFASEEYPEFACSTFNDVFGFFIQGPGYPVPTNIAIIPGTNLPVTINNIHPANAAYPNCNPVNAQYYNNNNNSSMQPVYDGFTDVFIAQAIVVPCQEYTIKLAIADASDQVYDSGVFLEAKSFGTGSLRAEVATVSLDGTITEGCATGTITFSLPDAVENDFPIDYNIWGTAINGVDYDLVPDNLFIPAGQSSVTLVFNAIEDNILEGMETIAVDVQRDPCNRDTVYISIRENTLISPMLRPDTSFCVGAQPLDLDGTLNIPLPPPVTFTNPQNYTINPINTAIFSPINVSGIQPVILDAGMIQSVCININHNWVDDLDLYLISPGGQFIELSTDNGANGDNYIQTCFTPTATTSIIFPGTIFAPFSSAPFTGNFQPEGVWSDLWDGAYPANGTWRLQMIDDQGGVVGELQDWSITFEPTYKIQYQWSPALGLTCTDCAITTATPPQTTLYTLQVTDSYGCVVKDSVELEVKPNLPAPVVSCGNSNATAVSFVWNPVPQALGYEVNVNGTGWVNVSLDTSYTVSGLPPSSIVTLEVRGIGNFPECNPLVGNATCVNCNPPNVTAAPNGVTCFGYTDGDVTFSTDNLNPPYTFRVGAVSNATGFFNNLSAGNYVGTITDGSGCDTLVNFDILTPEALTIDVSTAQQVSCFGGANGALTALGAGGTTTYSYNWDTPGGAIGNTVTQLQAGTYNVTLTDANGCMVVSFGTVNAPPLLTGIATATDVLCNGSATGSLDATGNGGVEPYSYNWNNSQSGASLVNVLPGSYIVTITDVNSCTTTASTTIAQPPLLTAQVVNTAAKCSDTSDGTATVNPAGGTSPYTYIWSDPLVQNTASAVNLAVGVYTVTVTDSHDCTTVVSTTIGAPPALTASSSSMGALCNGAANGTATVVPTGGNGTYSYLWNTPGVPQIAATATGLASGSYIVTVSDIKGCSLTTTVFVGEPVALLPSTTSSSLNCYGDTDGVVKVNITGGTMPYNYLWSSGATQSEVSGLAAGNYVVTVTDDHNCTVTASASIGQPSPIVAAITPTAVLCHDGYSGAISMEVVGGAGGYSVVWFGPDMFLSTELSFDSIYAGEYVVTITDASQCTSVESITIYEPATSLSVAAPLISDTICFEANDGIARIYAQGGTTPYTFQWDDPNGQSTQFPSGLPVNVYHVTITDANGCYQVDSTYIYQKPPMFMYVVDSLPRCFDGQDAYATIEFISYGSDPYDPSLWTYVWNTTPPQTGRRAIGLWADSMYMVTATDETGCTAVQTVRTYNQPPYNGFFTEVLNPLCDGALTGRATINGNGGNPPYSFLWSPNIPDQTNPQATQLESGTYRVTITDHNLCQTISEIELTAPPAIIPALSSRNVPCNGASSGQLMVSATGGDSPYSYIWSSGQQGDVVSGVPAGIYSVTVIDKNGCEKTDSVVITEPLLPLGASVTDEEVTCFNGSDGRLEIMAAGGVPPYQYALDNRPWNGSPIQIGLKAGNYIPRILDANGCELALPPMAVLQPNPIDIDLGPEITIELGQGTQLLAEIFNAHDPYTVRWNAADSLWLSCLDCINPYVDSLFHLQTFHIFVTDAKGCTGENEITVRVDKPRRIYVPTGFTPNGDFANDKLLVHGQESARILDFRVFDRWGELVYQATDFVPNDEAAGWDGNFRGKTMLPGVYVWTLEVEYLDGEKELLHGQTTLIR